MNTFCVVQPRARAMLAARAFVHQYEAAGLSAAELGEALDVAADVADAYAAL
jgi:hypothetical protein